MAPLTRSVHYELPEVSLEAPKVEGKDIQASSYPITLAIPEVPRLVTYKSKSGSCCTCGKTSSKACADCCGNVFYCNTECQIAHWPQHKESCEDIKIKHQNQMMEARDANELKQVSEDLGKIISSDFKSLDYKTDQKLSIKIDKTASFGDFYDVSENSESTIRKFYSGTYRCTSVTPDANCAPVTIYHHELVDPTKVMKQCILMSKDFFEHTGMPNQITMPDWCNWESADEEYIPSDSESDLSDSEPSEEFLLFTDFVERVFDDKPGMESDSEDKEYDPSESDSESDSSGESDVSDHEFDYLISESKQYIKDLPQKRQSIAPTAEMEVVEEDVDEGEDSEVEAYKDFKEKVLESEHKFGSDIEDSDYLPYSESESDSGESEPEREVSDSERCLSDNEVEEILESGKDIRDLDGDLYDEFIENTLDKDHTEESDAEDGDFTPADVDSASSEDDEISEDEEKDLHEQNKDFIRNLPRKRQSYQTEFSSSDESESDSDVSSEGELYEDFKIHTEGNCDLSDTEDQEYIPKQSDSEASSSSSSEDEMEISDAESDAVVGDSKDVVSEVSGNKRKCGPAEDSEDSDNEAEMESEDEQLYNDFRSKLIVSDSSKVVDLGGSDDEEFVPSKESLDESQDNSQDESQDDSQDGESQASDKSGDEMDVSADEIDDLEISSEDELYEEFKDEVCKTQKKAQMQKPKLQKTPTENKELIYFMNSLYTSSLKDSLESGKIEKGTEISESFLLKDGAKLSGIAVEMKGRNWRSAHAFEDISSGKCFALVVSTDPWEHLSNNHEELEAQYPEQKWSSVAETELKFEMKNFCSA